MKPGFLKRSTKKLFSLIKDKTVRKTEREREQEDLI